VVIYGEGKWLRVVDWGADRGMDMVEKNGKSSKKAKKKVIQEVTKKRKGGNVTWAESEKKRDTRRPDWGGVNDNVRSLVAQIWGGRGD